jgi:chromosome segregation ATPase
MYLIVQIQSALEKAQEVMNDQYVITHGLQAQVNTLLEGVRILNEHIEEYDKRLDGVQTSTQTFFAEIQAELNRRNTVLSQMLDTMHDRITSQISAKADTHVSAPSNSPRAELSRTGITPTFQNSISNVSPGTSAIITSQMESQAKSINDLRTRLGQLHTQVMAHNHTINSVVSLPGHVQQFCDEISNRLLTIQREAVGLAEKVKTAELSVNNIGTGLQKQMKTTDSNFRETAVHMNTVKSRFGEHRRQLDNLIVAWRDAVMNIDQLNGKYEALKDFLSVQLVPTISKIHKAFPGLFENSGSDPKTIRSQQTGDGTATQRQNQVAAPTTQSEGQRPSGGGEDGGGASNPIEV